MDSQSDTKQNVLNVVFVHGIGGTAESFADFPAVMRADDDFANVVITQHEYITGVFRPMKATTSTGRKPEISDIRSLARSLCSELEELSGEIVVIGHSMGGLIARSVVLEAARNKEPSPLDRLIMLATPHNGSKLNWLAKLVPMKSKQTRDLLPGSDYLMDLDEGWRDCRLAGEGWRGCDLGEESWMYAIAANGDGVINDSVTKSEYQLKVCGKKFWDSAAGKDHKSVCKIHYPNDKVYELVKNFILREGKWPKATKSADDTGSQRHAGKKSQLPNPVAHSDSSCPQSLFLACEKLSETGMLTAFSFGQSGPYAAGAYVSEHFSQEWRQRQFFPVFFNLVDQVGIDALKALEDFCKALLLQFFVDQPDADSRQLIRFDRASDPAALYLCVDASIANHIPTVSISAQARRRTGLQQPELALPLKKDSGLQLDSGAQIEATIVEIEAQLSPPEERLSQRVESPEFLADRLIALQDRINNRQYTSDHLLIYGDALDTTVLQRLKSDYLQDTRIFVIEDDAAARDTQLEQRIRAFCEDTLGKIEFRLRQISKQTGTE